MKRVMFLFLLAALVILCASSQLFSIDLKKGTSEPVAPRAGDISVDIDLSGGEGEVYRSGKEISLSFSASRDAYVIVYNVDGDGYVHLLYPEDGNPVLTEGQKTYALPEPGKGVYWEAGDRTGIEYIHAVAVADRASINDDELYFLSQNDRLSEEKRFRVDLDPFLAFNMIDEELVRNAEAAPPATAYTYFYVNRNVEYPRYLCSKCHTPEKITDPYAMECSEIVIAKLSYDEVPHYPYPPLYDIRHVNEAEKELDGDRDGEKWIDDDDDTDVALSFSFGIGDYPYYMGFSAGYYPFAYDPFWCNFGWSFYWGDYYWWPSCGWWYPPYSYWGNHYCYPYWDCNDYWYGCGDEYCYGYPTRSSYAERNLVRRRSLDYAQTNESMQRTRTLTKTRNESIAQRLERSTLQKRTLDRTIDRPTLARADRLSASSREAARTIIYGGERASRGTTRDANRTMRQSGSSRSRSGGSRAIAPPPGRSGTDRGTSTRRDVIRHAAPQRKSPESAKPQESSPGGRSGSQQRSRSTVDRRRASSSSGSAPAHTSARSASSPSRAASPARSVSAPARSAARAASAPSRSAGGGGGRSRSR